MDVMLPDGTRIQASSIFDRAEDDPSRDFSLYMDARSEPSWPSDMIDWPDFGLPSDERRAATQIRDAFLRARSGETVEVGCLGGLGRTGTVLACMTVLKGWTHLPPSPGSSSTTDLRPSKPPIKNSGWPGSVNGIRVPTPRRGRLPGLHSGTLAQPWVLTPARRCIDDPASSQRGVW